MRSIYACMGVAFLLSGSSNALAKPTSAKAGAMVMVPAGKFYMGCNEQVDKVCLADEKPGKEVHVPAFRIDKYEVTVAQYKKCVDAGTCTKPKTGESFNWSRDDRENHPVNGVSWNDAQAYCKWVGNKRLPTEQEWEKAARGTDGRKYTWGSKGYGSRKVANIADKNSGLRWTAKKYVDPHKETAPVGSYPEGVSPYGALDMVGNVSEWTDGWYTKGERRPIRGGSWFTIPRLARASSRVGFEPGGRYKVLGFRCAKTAK